MCTHSRASCKEVNVMCVFGVCGAAVSAVDLAVFSSGVEATSHQRDGGVCGLEW